MGILSSGFGNFHGLKRWDEDAEFVRNRIMGRRQGDYSSFIQRFVYQLCKSGVMHK